MSEGRKPEEHAMQVRAEQENALESRLETDGFNEAERSFIRQYLLLKMIDGMKARLISWATTNGHYNEIADDIKNISVGDALHVIEKSRISLRDELRITGEKMGILRKRQSEIEEWILEYETEV